MTEDDVRASMLYLTKNKVVQYLLTLLTGKALPGQEPLIKSTRATQSATAIAMLIIGVIGSYALINFGNLYSSPLLLETWLFTVAGARKFQGEIHHFIVHNLFTGKQWLDRLISDIITTILLIQPYDEYKADHGGVHHTLMLATMFDPDALFLRYLGFKPGVLKEILWLRFLITLISPRFHLTFLYLRLKANFTTKSRRRVFLSAFWMLCLVAIAFSIGFVTMFVVWVIPIFWLYHMSSICQFLTEHLWFQPRNEMDTNKEHLEKLTRGRFFGEAYPYQKNFLAKVVWAFRMVIHAHARLVTCQGTLSCHDGHHYAPGLKDWANLIFIRQWNIDAGVKGWQNCRETWGLINMIDGIFEHFASLPPIEETETISSTSLKEVVLGM